MSKYKVGDKVVMKIISADQDEIKTYSVSGVNDDWRWCLPQNLLERYTEPLSTYTEPLEAKIRRQAAEITRLLAENEKLKAENGNSLWNIEQARANGAEAAWELVRKIVKMKLFDYKEIFNSQTLRTAINMTYPEAAAKVEAWERQKEEICIGDVVRYTDGTYGAVLQNGHMLSVMLKDGSTTPWHKDCCRKTGRHIDIDGFLKQIGGEQK